MNWKKITGINKTFDSKKEAEQAEYKYKQLLENPLTEIDLYSLFDEFVVNTKGQLKESSIKQYGIFKRNYLPLIPNKKIMDITIKDIQDWKNKFYSKKLTATTINRHKNIMLSLLKYGSQMYEMKAKVQLPLMESYQDNNVQQTEAKQKYIPPKDFNILVSPLLEYIEYNNNLYYYTIIKILYNTGMRVGELSALTIDDITDTYINVNKDYARVNGKDIIQTTKSKNSIRKVYLDQETKDLLKNYIEKYKPTGILFRLESDYMTQQRLRQVLNRLGIITKLNEKYEIKVHNLRHSHASNLRLLGYDEILISKRLGNTPNVALQTYIHSQDSELQELAKKLENLEN